MDLESAVKLNNNFAFAQINSPHARNLFLNHALSFRGAVVALLVVHWICDSQVAGSSPGRAPSASYLTGASLSPSSIIWYKPKSGYVLWLGR